MMRLLRVFLGYTLVAGDADQELFDNIPRSRRALESKLEGPMNLSQSLCE